jgi:hypothetical protein
MKCFYSIPEMKRKELEAVCQRYAESLHDFSDGVSQMGDKVYSFANTFAESVLKIDDGDWVRIRDYLQSINPTVKSIIGELIWTPTQTKAISDALIRNDELKGASHDKVFLGSWLESEGTLKSRIVLMLSE